MFNYAVLISLLSISFNLLNIQAQTINHSADKEINSCGFYSHGSEKYTSPEFQNALQRQSHTGSNERRTSVVYKLPVVVHVITSSECEEVSSIRNKFIPSDELIRFEIEEASQRFRHNYPGAKTYTNPYYGIDTEIELALATVDPDGNYTSGIIWTVDPAVEGKSWGDAAYLVDKYKWDTRKYCNIFIVKRLTNAAAAYTEGLDFTIYSGSAFWSGLINHELGHYLGLQHTFLSESSYCPSNTDCLTSGDRVCDTPPKYSAGSLDELCEGNLFNSCSSDEADVSTNNPYRPVALGGMGDQQDMTTNYMDYSGPCWDSYTLGQKNIMRATIELKTEMIAFADLAFNTPLPPYYLNVSDFKVEADACIGKFTPIVSIENKGTSELTSATAKIVNGSSTLTQINWTGNLLPGESTEITFSGIEFNSNLALKAVFENPNNESSTIYQTGVCQKLVYNNPSSRLYIPFSACQNYELGTISNDVELTWSAEKFKPYRGYHSCRECVAALLNNYSIPYEVQTASFELPIRDFTAFNKPAMSFIFGYLPSIYSGPFDTLSVKVAAGCESFETVWQGTGLELATNNPPAYHESEYFMNVYCEVYKNVTIDMVRFAGESDVRIMVEAKGLFMGPLLIDEIIVDNNLITADIKKTHEIDFAFTNPVDDYLSINSETEFNTFQVLNLAGQIILESKSMEIEVSKLRPGVYLLVGRNKKDVVVKKFVKE